MLLLKNCFHIATLDNRNCMGTDILIKDNLIEKIGNKIDLQLYKNEHIEVIDCSHCVVIPGGVNTHHHFFQVLTRNIPAVQNAKLFDWLTYLYELWAKLDEEAVFYSTLAATGELLKTGCTCAIDHHYVFPERCGGNLIDIQMEAAEKTGIRFAPIRGSMSKSKKNGGLPPDSVVQSEDTILADSLRLIEKYNDDSNFSMRKIILGPCSPFSVTPELMIESVKLARKHNVRLQTHLAETIDENNYCLNIHNKRPLGLMEDWGFIGEDVSYAHGIHFNDDELKILASTGTTVCHCPSSNMRLASGIARVKEMLDLKINVSLALDGSASNDTSDFLGEMRNSLLLQRVKYGENAMTTDSVLKIAVENGNKYLGYKKIGKIKEGWGADLAIFNLNKLEHVGSLSDPLAALIFTGISHQTEYTIVNGKVVVRNGRLTGFNEETIITKANAIAAKLLL